MTKMHPVPVRSPVPARVGVLTLLLALAPLALSCGLFLAPGDCTQASDCFGDNLCVDGECVECERDRDCDDDEECDDGDCEPAGEGEGEGEGEGDPGEGEGEGDPGEGEGEGECVPGCESVSAERTCNAAGDPVIVPCESNEVCSGLACELVQGQEYEGSAEAGVVCDATTCSDPNAVCCVTVDVSFAIVGNCIASSGSCTGALLAVPVVCDGAEDCELSEECCLDGATNATSCVSAGSCVQAGQTDAVVCVSTDDCGSDELCCGFAGGSFQLPVDVGICSPAANNCSS
ncbi:MAG: hypothetical protein IT383_21085 [Deltaproteobacteria bacterium]|nr:hypothetical protein [Deltaproteobacteria bacterium]